MEITRGKKTSFIGASELTSMIAGYEAIHVDIGTGDGRFVRNLAQSKRSSFVIGVDACRENLYDVARRAPNNALFVIANAYTLPLELDGLATHITINFPWGSLIEGLLYRDATLLTSIERIAQKYAEMDVYLNGGALAEAGFELEIGTKAVQNGLSKAGFFIKAPLELAAHDLKAYPTTWAKRLAFGRDPRAMYLHGVRKG